MMTPEDLVLMTEDEKVEFLRTVMDAEEWQDCFAPIYERLMDDESARVRQEAVAALWDLADPRLIEPLMQKARSDPSTEVRAKAVSVLGIYIYEGAVMMELDQSRYLAVRGYLLQLARDTAEPLSVRRMAIEALSFDTDEEIQDLIAWAYQHSSVEMRVSAVFAMGRSQSSRWFDTILSEMLSSDTRMQLEAVNAAGEVRLAEATPRLRSLVSHPDNEVRLAAIWSLGCTRGPGALETLELCTQSPDEEVRRVALQALDEYHAGESEDADYDDDSDPDD